jgi:hypothetical protein
MIPTNSSSSTNGCDNISSNCVIWQGPDITCIDLCNGDTISVVVSNLATEVCTLMTEGVVANPNLTGLDLSCLNIQGITPTTLIPVLQAMVVQICTNTSSTGGGSFDITDLPIMALPECLWYNDGTGNPVRDLRLDLFATLIANKVCDILYSINVINSTLIDYNTRLVILENCVLPCTGAVVEAQVVPTCLMPTVLTDVSALLLVLEAEFCSFRSAVGLIPVIAGAIQQTVIINSTDQLSNPGSNYGSVGGWNSPVINLAQSVQNAWVVIDDMYAAITAIQLNCCSSGCDTVVFDYTTTALISPTGLMTALTFNFTTCSIPAAFNDCYPGNTTITISDVTGAAIVVTANVSQLQNDPNGVLIPLPGLNTNDALTTEVVFCAYNGTDSCNDTQVQTVAGVLPCPDNITATVMNATSVNVGFINTAGTGAQYTIDILNGNVVTATRIVTSPGTTVNETFTGLTPITIYTVRISILLNGVSKLCPKGGMFTTGDVVEGCAAGMDVAFILDYTATMGSVATELKDNIGTIITVIDTQSGANDYRLGLVLADEGEASSPNYATSTDYVPGLPIGQRLIVNSGSYNQYITAVEKFTTNNQLSFGTQLNKIDTGIPTAGWPLGGGVSGPDPVDMAIGQVVESTAFLGAFRTGVAKNLLIYTDALPSGSDDRFTAADITRLNALAITCATAGIRCYVLGAGVDETYTPSGGVLTHPWRDFADSTAGAWNASYTCATAATMINDGCV